MVDFPLPFPNIKKLLKLIDRGHIREVYLILGKGSGKSTIVQICSLYGVYLWTCMRDPFDFYKILRTAKPACVNVSISREQAQDVIFDGCFTLVNKSEFFENKFKEFKKYIKFDSGITLYAGHGNAAAWLGYATFVGGMDEVEYMVDNSNRSQAQMLYNALRGSLRTRFPNVYKLVAISSAKERYSFLMKKASLVIKTGTSISFDDPEKSKEDCFEKYLQSQASIDLADFNSIEVFLRGLKIQAAETATQMAVIAPTWLVSTREKLEDFLPDFRDEDQRALALRDFACVPVFSINPFFKNPAAIYARADDSRACPIEPDLSISDAAIITKQFIPYPGAKYYFASDLSVNTDAMGLAMICEYPLALDAYELVFSLEIKVSKESEANYEAVELLVKMLRARHFSIAKVGFDQFQSHRTKQFLEKDNFKVEIVSYHDSFACQRTLKELITTGRFIYGECDEVFMGEAAELQVINSKRIDHLSSGGIYNSKNVWDAAVDALKLCMDSDPAFVPEYT